MSFPTGLRYLKQDSLPHMWCPGCGNGIVLGAMLRAFEELAYTPNEVVVVTGIGCWGKADDYVVTNALHTTHGRALAFATGVKAANPKLHVVVLMGDGDGVTIGGNHLLHAARRNIDVTAIIVNNYNYGMTGGQFSATTPAGSITSTTIQGNPERDIDVCALAEVAGANYVARETVVNPLLLQARIREALTNQGFSLVEAVSPCTTLFGPNNKMKRPLDMFAWLKERGMAQSLYSQINDPSAYVQTGKLVDRSAPDFNTSYDKVWAKVRQGESR